MLINTQPVSSMPALAAEVAIGDVVFIRIPIGPFTEVADATLSWTNHVGVVVATDVLQLILGDGGMGVVQDGLEAVVGGARVGLLVGEARRAEPAAPAWWCDREVRRA